jgi:lambda repressor-like predicted transcriptional regulator
MTEITVDAAVLRDLIRAKIRETSLRAVSQELKISHVALRELLEKSREPGSRIAEALGYKRLPVRYQKIPRPETP